MDDSIGRNREHWGADAPNWADAGRRSWARDEPAWGIWGVPESQLGILEGVAGADAVELGVWHGVRLRMDGPPGRETDRRRPTPAQLRTAQALQRQFDIRFPLVEAAGEHVPLRSSSFDFVVSEYGAAIWADPHKWIPEAARLLRPGGQLVFLGNAALLMLCVPDEEYLPAGPELLRPQFGMHRFEWPDTSCVEFHLSHGEMIRLLRSCGFEVLDLVEVRPGPDAVASFEYVSVDWARRWPSEEVWRARRR